MICEGSDSDENQGRAPGQPIMPPGGYRVHQATSGEGGVGDSKGTEHYFIPKRYLNFNKVHSR